MLETVGARNLSCTMGESSPTPRLYGPWSIGSRRAASTKPIAFVSASRGAEDPSGCRSTSRPRFCTGFTLRSNQIDHRMARNVESWKRSSSFILTSTFPGGYLSTFGYATVLYPPQPLRAVMQEFLRPGRSIID